MYTYVAGVDHERVFKFQDVYKFPHFCGCLTSVSLNGRNLLKGFYNHDNKNIIKISGTVKSGCHEAKVEGILGFTGSLSFLKISRIMVRNTLNIKFSFRTYVDTGKIFKAQPSKLWLITLALNSGRLELKLQFIHGVINKVFPFTIGEDLGDGNWHGVEVVVKSSKGLMVLDGKTVSLVKPFILEDLSFSFTTIVFGGGSIASKDGFIGCLKDLRINNINTSIQGLEHFQIKVNSCPIENHCFPNPCKNEGVCTNVGSHFTCDCDHTMYSGFTCSHPLYRSTCQEYFELGLKKDSTCLVSPGYNGSTNPFNVICKRSNSTTPSTVILNKKTGWQTVEQYKDKLSGIAFLDYTSEYSTSLPNVKALISRSRKCQQYLALNYSMGGRSKFHNVFWVSAKGRYNAKPFISNGK